MMKFVDYAVVTFVKCILPGVVYERATQTEESLIA